MMRELRRFILELDLMTLGLLLMKLNVSWTNPDLVRCILQVLPKKSMTKHMNRFNLYQACQSKDQTILGLSNDLGALQNEVAFVQSQLQSQVSKCSKYETILGHKDGEG